MKADIVVSYQFSADDLEIDKEGENTIGSITYSNHNNGDLHRFIDNLNDMLDVYQAQIDNWNRASILGSVMRAKRITIRFKREDSTVIDEVAINPDSIVEIKRLITAFYTC